MTKTHHFKASADFEQINNGPDLTLQVSNTGISTITSLSVQFAGQGLSLAWSPSLPAQPGQTTTTTTVATPLGLVLAVGDIYSLTISASYSDGTTDTQTLSVIYTLGAGIGL